MGEYNNIDIAMPGLKADADMITRIESHAAQENIGFGVPVYSYIGEDERVSLLKNDTATLVYDADFVTGNLIDVTVDGEAITQVPFDTDQATTAAAVVSAISALVGVDALLDSTDVTNRTILIRKKYVALVVSTVVTAGATQATGTPTYSSDQIFAGVTLFVQKSVGPNGVGGYLADEAVSVLVQGILWAFNDGTALANDVANVSDTQFVKTGGTDVGAQFKSNNVLVGSDNLAQVQVNGTSKLGTTIEWV